LISRRVLWEIIDDNLHKAGWSLGWFSALDREGRTNIVRVAGKARYYNVSRGTFIEKSGHVPDRHDSAR